MISVNLFDMQRRFRINGFSREMSIQRVNMCRINGFSREMPIQRVNMCRINGFEMPIQRVNMCRINGSVFVNNPFMRNLLYNGLKDGYSNFFWIALMCRTRLAFEMIYSTNSFPSLNRAMCERRDFVRDLFERCAR